MRFEKSSRSPGAGRTRVWHHHGSHTPTSTGAILQVKWPVNPNILAASVSHELVQNLRWGIFLDLEFEFWNIPVRGVISIVSSHQIMSAVWPSISF